MALPSPVVTLSIRDRIRAEFDFDPKATDERVAERVLRDVTKYDLLPLLVQEVGIVSREEVRRREKAVIPHIVARFRPAPRIQTSPEEQRARVHALRPSQVHKLRRSDLDLGDGTTVSWGQATVEQLKRRVAMIDQHTKGLAETRELIVGVIETLEQTGASCLDELDI